MWDLPEAGLEPVSPALAGGFLTTTPPGKSLEFFFNKDSLRDLCNNIKGTNICIIRVPEGEERAKASENLLEKIIAENFPNLEWKQISSPGITESPK